VAVVEVPYFGPHEMFGDPRHTGVPREQIFTQYGKQAASGKFPDKKRLIIKDLIPFTPE